jgi:hypothetical protein
MSDPIREMQEHFARSATLATAPFDPELHRQAEATAGHIDMKAVGDEYHRLVLQKYHRPEPRGFWSRLLGR